MEWISVKDALPEDDVPVLVVVDSVFTAKHITVAYIKKGITIEQRERMKRGDFSDQGCYPGREYDFYGADQWANNKVPYKWYVCRTHKTWFGQDVTHWMPLPELP